MIFEIPSECWPTELYLDMLIEVAAKLLPYLQRASIEVDAEDHRALARQLNESAWFSFMTRLRSERALGLLLNRFLMFGGRLWPTGNEGLQLVIRKTVPRRAILRLATLSLTNVEARERRSRAFPDE